MDAGKGTRGDRVDGTDQRMRMWTAHERGVQQSRQRDIGRKASRATQEARIFDAPRPRADDTGGAHLRIRAAASSAAATMFW